MSKERARRIIDLAKQYERRHSRESDVYKVQKSLSNMDAAPESPAPELTEEEMRCLEGILDSPTKPASCNTHQNQLDLNLSLFANISKELNQNQRFLGDLLSNDLSPLPGLRNDPVTNITICTRASSSSSPLMDMGENFMSATTPVPSPCLSFSDSPALSSINSNRSPPMSVTNSDCSLPCVRRRKCEKKEYPGKKKTHDKSSWKDVRRKALHNLGHAYVSRNGKPQLPKLLKPPCPDSCRLKCFQKFSVETRQSIFRKFYDMGDHSHKWLFISKYTQRRTKRRITTDENSKRLYSVQYFLPAIDSKDEGATPSVTRVCKSMFKNTLSIGNQFIQTAIDKYDNGMGSHIQDERGKHQHHKKIINEEMKNSVISHINSFQPVESHYIRKDSKRLYLDNSLSFPKMFEMYKEWCRDNNSTNIVKTLRQYRDIVNKHMNVGFYVPKKDQCDVCHSFKNRTARTEQDKLNHQKHIESKEVSRLLKAQDKADAMSEPGKIANATFDFQKILNVPHADISVLYYKRKLSLYNFTNFDTGLKEGICYMWDEGKAKRGANEVASCLLSFLKKKAEIGVTDVRLWSDNCGGQNRNRIVFLMYMYASIQLKINICHRFLEKGHTQAEGDSVHALIERKGKRKTIYTPMEWFTLIRWAKTDGKPYEVIEVAQEDIVDFKSCLNVKYWAKDIENNRIRRSNVKEIKVQWENPDVLYIKYDLSDPQSKIVDCSHSISTRRRQYSIQPQPLYKKPIPIPLLKYKDLVSLCESNIIPSRYHGYFKNLEYVENSGNSNSYNNDEEDCD